MEHKRSFHFTEEDKNLLLALIAERKDVIENKLTDGLNLKIKNQAWLEIWEIYNAGVKYPRTVNQLKIGYKNMKAANRKTDEKIERLKRSLGPICLKLENLECDEVDLSQQSFAQLSNSNTNIMYENCDSTDLKPMKRMRSVEMDATASETAASCSNSDSNHDSEVCKKNYGKEIHEMAQREHEMKMNLMQLDMQIKNAQLRQTLLDIQIKEKQLKSLV